MDSVSRYINVKALKIGNDLIPIWDSEIEFEKTDDYGEQIRYKRNTYHQLHDCVYDLKKRVLLPGYEIDLYPDEKKDELKKGMSCYYEKSHHKLEEVTIVDIIFESFDTSIMRGKKMDKWYKERFKDIIIESDDLYCIKSWKPTYVLSNGVKTEYSHQIYQKV